MSQQLFPMFPLELVLLPEELLPLHVFEDRYKMMIGECLEAKTRDDPEQEFGVVLAKDSAIQSVGCAARIVNVTRQYDDGRMDILAVGRSRFTILDTNEDKPYLRCGIDFFEDDPGADVAGEREAAEAIELFRQSLQRLRHSAEMPVHLPRPYRYLSYRMAASLPVGLEFKQDLLSVRDESERLDAVIRLMKLLLARLDTLEKVQKKAGGNGDITHKLS